MKREFREYQKKNDFLICVDSDGTVMNTMEIKHGGCFGPCLVEEWGLQQYKEQVLRIWNAISLYSINRGINRFMGLQLVLEYIDKHITPIEEVDALARWVATTPELSNAALIRYLEDDDSHILPKVLRWSQTVSQHISMIPLDIRRPYDGVLEALMVAREDCDIAVVSATNPDAIYEEWEFHGLAYFVDLILNQNVGSKAFCITQLLESGYDPANVMMIGNAIKDLEVAKACGVCFYPIVLGKETASWQRFEGEALSRFYEGTYVGAYEDELIDDFIQALNANYE